MAHQTSTLDEASTLETALLAAAVGIGLALLVITLCGQRVQKFVARISRRVRPSRHADWSPKGGVYLQI